MNIEKTAAALLLGAAIAAGASAAQAAAPDGKARTCFYSNDWRGWSSPDPAILYIKVGVNDVYRVDLQGNRTALESPGRFLVHEIRGTSSVCSALDLDLSISDHQGFKTPLFPTQLTKLTDEEVQAIPRKDRP